MTEWLQANMIHFTPKACKNEIFSIIHQQNLMARYVVDDMAAAIGKKFLMIATHQQCIEFLGRT